MTRSHGDPGDSLSPDLLVEQAGATPLEIDRLTKLGILGSDGGRRYTDADVRRVLVIRALEQSGLPSERLAALVDAGRFSLDFLDRAGRNVFSPVSRETFAEVSDRTGVPIAILSAIREATGGRPPGPSDRVREDELRIVPLVEAQHKLGFRASAITRAIRVYGESLRRIAEAEAEWWRSEIQEPMLAAGASADEVTLRAAELSPGLSRDADAALSAMYHAQQMLVWLANLVDGITAGLERAGLHERDSTIPVVAFLDLAGYTELTEQRGDAAATAVIERLNRIVHATAVEHGGRPTKWLGDGVMLHFPDPAAGVTAALAMVGAVPEAGLPPAHVGLDAGPVVIQQGDLFGHTVNVAARVGEFARPGEVLVTRSVVDAAHGAPLEFVAIGPVELKGLAEPLELFAARHAQRA